MDTERDKKYIQKYIDDECSRDEFDVAYELIVSSDAAEKYDELWFQHWKKCLNSEASLKPSVKSGEKASYSGKSRRLLSPTRILRYAAGLALLISVYWLVIFLGERNDVNYTQLFATSITKENIVLDDGSNVILGEGSQLYIANDFDKRRSLKLLGEAVFNVENIEDSPFLVHSDELRVQVIGTSFLIRNFVHEPQILLTVNSGIVEASFDSEHSDKSYRLTKDMQLCYDKNSHTIVVNSVESSKMLLPGENTLYFKDTPFYMIITDIERRYGVKVGIDDPTILKFKITGEHSNENLDELLESICFVYGLQYERIGAEEILISYE